MKLIFPFTYMDQWHFERYKDQFRALCGQFEKVTIPVQYGVEVENDIENLDIRYYRIMPPSQNRKWTVRIKNFVKKITLYAWVKRLEQNRLIVKHWIDEGIEGDAVLSYSGAGINQTLHCNLAEALGIPVIHRMRGDGVKERSMGGYPLNRIISNHFHFSSLRRYDLHIPINLDYQSRLIEWGVQPGKIVEPVGLGVDVEQFKATGDKPTRLTLGYFGRLGREKNTEVLIEMMKATPAIQYLVLGKPLNKFKFPDNCKYLGYVPKHKMPFYYDKINALLNPSFSEGFPNILLEAYASSTPLIGSPETFPLGVPIFGEKIELDFDLWVECLNNLKIRALNRQGEKARKWVLNHTWEKWGEKIATEIKRYEK